MIGDEIAAVLPELRTQAESLMLDTFTAYSPDPDNPSTDANGYEVPGWADEGSTSGKVSGRSREGDTNTRLVSIGGVERPVVDGGLHIPLDSAVPAIGWEYECTAVGPVSDPSLVGRRWRVMDVPAKSYATARRLDVVEV